MSPRAEPHPVRDAPAFVVIYAASKYGKTTDVLFALPRAFYIALPAALRPSINIVGFQLHPSQIKDVDRISDATQIVAKLSGDFDAIVCDDFSLLADKTFAALEKAGLTGFKLWGALRNEVLAFRDAARRCGKHVILTCHEAPPSVKNGWNVRGGPRLPGRLPEELPAHCDIVLRAAHMADRKGPWPMVYRCSPADSAYISGDRNGVTPDYAPMNLGEILRASGFKIRRAPGLDWMEEIVELGAATLVANDATKEEEILRWIVSEVSKRTTDTRHIVWVLRDARDRALFRAATSRHLDAFFKPANAGFGGSTF